MRDILVSLLLISLMPSCFKRPFIGLLVFSWLAYMRVQDLTWGFARFQRWSYYVALLMFAGFLFHRRERWFLRDVRSHLMIMLAVALGLGVAFSPGHDLHQFQRYLEYVKIIAVALFTTAVVNTREHLRVITWVIALSLGFYGVKSGIWGIASGGGKILQGPGGMLADNNDFAAALSMAVPMLFCLGVAEKREVVRRAFFLCVPLTILTVGLTYSRGGFLACSVAIAILVWRSRNRVAGVAIAVLIAIAAVIVMPPEYKERLATIRDPRAEGSAASRLRAWRVATLMALDNPILGVGFGKFRQNWLRYCEDPTPKEVQGKAVIVAHSSYFQIWAECGTPALLMYLSLIVISFVSIWRVRKMARTRYFSSWILNYATMFEASLAAFVVGSAFLNRAHFDLFYHWVAVIAMFAVIARREMTDTAAYPLRSGARGSLREVRPRGFAHGDGPLGRYGLRPVPLRAGEA